MDFLNSKDLTNLKNYKYYSEDRSPFTKVYMRFWTWIQKYIPKKIHPNIITLIGIFSVIFAYGINSVRYSNLVMGLAILIYLNTDSIDGLHARNTKQMSIIGEYFDHLGDLVVLGFAGTYLLNMMGFSSNLIVNNIIMLFSSMNFIKYHWESIIMRKIIFEGFSDTTLILTLIILLVLGNFKLPEFLLNNYWAILITSCVPVLIQYIQIWVQEIFNPKLRKFKNLWFRYWVIKFILLVLKPTVIPWTIPIVDLVLLLETINFKIFNKTFISQHFLLSIPLINIISEKLCLLIVLGYIGYFIYSISSQLKINLFINPPSVYLPRVYCCGVFDLCHLGHMKLFEKITKSFDHPIWLIVGVHSDATVRDYKREPIINEKFRIGSVELCKYVDEVQPDAALVVTKEFCLENKIDVVIIGEEYKGNKDIMWYKGGMELGIHKYISRFEELSTTDIIKKIKLYE